ncbi:3-carboxy-cis,cis-muconate cycloisomerase [Rhizobium sp. Root482]|uniref:3-carboxy-cis,cis-muconate cycloisomerase n=1 Tax=Rhizobium sp. Root482 TaxID=1736543 RepID=UPI0006FCA117|nr:3-carboxy-cis,cis-muconate cycloisomerase [Rhizobium sp. Root482]KQY13904.1 3-carboxy-cis,cis-muconate cycloisomerase [Rhizobium sp. Root482]
MTVSPFDHPYLVGLLGDEETAAQFSAAAEIEAMLRFEVALARAECDEGVVPVAAAERIAWAVLHFAPDMAALRQAVGRDGVVVPELVRQLREAVGPEHGQYVHFAATSQDVIDTGLMLRLKTVAAGFDRRIEALEEGLNELSRTFGANPLTGRTRMQAAIGITVSDRISSWATPLKRNRARLQSFIGDGLAVQFGGAAGTLDKLGEKGPAVRARLAAELSLADRPQWHSQRDGIAEFAGLLSLITGNLGKLGQDVALMAQEGTEIALVGGGTSSAMAHKQNPVAAETLVTLARFNAVQLSAMHHALVHEQERSGSAWTLEWMVLPQMTVATGAALRLAGQLLASIRSLGTS